MSELNRAIAITADHVAVLQAVEDAGGNMPLSDLIEVLTPGVMTRPTQTFGHDALWGVTVAGELRRWGMLDLLPFSTRRQITDAGRTILQERSKGALA